jgi:DeoR/GlpR family transcriptional regulator of sugar metabolism
VLSLERQRRLLQHIRQNGSGNVVELAGALGVSASTVRRDLKDMDKRGLLTRVHGGAGLPESAHEPVLASRESEHSAEKRRIGQAAAQFVSEGDTVLITGGTTTEAMLPHLADIARVTVLTNGLNIASRLAHYPNTAVVVLGGVLRHEEMSLLGPIAEQVLAEFHVDIAFSSAYGIDPEAGMTGANVTEAGTDRRMLQAATRLVLLADASKLGRRGPVRLASTEQIDYVVTDDSAPADLLRSLRDKGVDVVTC